jgi:hypothetical protein
MFSSLVKFALTRVFYFSSDSSRASIESTESNDSFGSMKEFLVAVAKHVASGPLSAIPKVVPEATYDHLVQMVIIGESVDNGGEHGR